MDYSIEFWLAFAAAWTLIGWTLGCAGSKAVSEDSYEKHSPDDHQVLTPQQHRIGWRRIDASPRRRD